MAENVIYVKGSRASVHRAIALAAQAASGASSSVPDAVGSMQVRVGLAALKNIRSAFVVKARGETDECGLSWPKLAKSTVAYSRRHPNAPARVQQAPSLRAKLAPSAMLTVKQRKRWWALQASVGPARAWMILKAEGAKTIIGEYGNMSVLILRSTGLLLNSFSPGIDPESETIPPTPPPVENQIFTISGEIIVGTNRKFAGTHHEGKGHVPQRRLWAEPSQWPSTWWGDLVDAATTGYIEIVLHMLKKQ